tara:strand:+ start:314 stop:1453 length:1140 start_codon:yes stop_codon:yes gene_type:complete
VIKDKKEGVLYSDYYDWNMGPYQSNMPVPLQLHIRSDGEIIHSVRYNRGYAYRGTEYLFEIFRWQQSIVLGSQIIPEAPLFSEWALCLAVERLFKIELSPKVECIRGILLELSRISYHLKTLSQFCFTMGIETVFHFMMRERELILNLFELMSGHRFGKAFFQFGGVLDDLSAGVIDRADKVCDRLLSRFKEYEGLSIENRTFTHRLEKMGLLTDALIHRYQITGPNAKAGGFSEDLRFIQPQGPYQLLASELCELKISGYYQSNPLTRFKYRIEEMRQSIRMIRVFLEELPQYSYLDQTIVSENLLPEGEQWVSVESPQGHMDVHLVSEGGKKFSRVFYHMPAVASLAAYPHLLKQSYVEDCNVIFYSLGVEMSEVDR